MALFVQAIGVESWVQSPGQLRQTLIKWWLWTGMLRGRKRRAIIDTAGISLGIVVIKITDNSGRGVTWILTKLQVRRWR